MIDLHTHSNCSDGLLSPQLLLENAKAAGLSVFALTDHDNIDGVNKLLQEAELSGLHFIPGVELSVKWKKHDIHVLGLNIDVKHPQLQEVLQLQAQHRKQRAAAIADKLTAIGLQDALAKAGKLAGHDMIGRPHFAQLLVNEGLAKDLQNAFQRYLVRGKAAFVETTWVSIQEAVSCINTASGMAVLAHPLKYKLTRTKLHELISDFKEAGGTGLEVVSGEMTQQDVNELAGLAHRFELLSSTGSDFHGVGISRVALGGQRQLPPQCQPIWHQWNI